VDLPISSGGVWKREFLNQKTFPEERRIRRGGGQKRFERTSWRNVYYKVKGLLEKRGKKKGLTGREST